MTKDIGLLGGTFDPPHIGHLVVADQVLYQLGLDEIWFLVAKDPWQKTEGGKITPSDHRLAMVRSAIFGLKGFVASDLEFSMPGPTYTVDTLDRLGEEFPGTRWHLILGSDAAAGLDTWHEPGRLARLAEIVVVNRGGFVDKTPPEFSVSRVTIPNLEVSSSEIRDRIRSDRSVRFLVPDRVIDQYERLNIYPRGQ